MPKLDLTKLKTTDDVIDILKTDTSNKIYMMPQKPYIPRKQGQVWIEDGKQ